MVAEQAHGQIRRVAGVFTDITDRRTADAAICDSQARFQLLVGSIAVGFTLAGPTAPGGSLVRRRGFD